jgi:hypothetical protein
MPLLKYYDAATSTWLPILAGAKGETGDTGPVGPQGPAGLGSVAVTSPITNSGTSTSAVIGIQANRVIPAGGSTGQVLAKSSATDFATTWQTPTVVGLQLLTSSSFSNTSTVIVDNVFNSQFDSYQVVFALTAASTGTEPTIRLRTSAGVTVNSGYQDVRQQSYISSWAGNSTTSAGSSRIGRVDVNGALVLLTINNPAVAARTFGINTSIDSINAQWVMAWSHTAATAYAGFIISFAGTMTGKVQVYGMKN